jgi:opacity protein-like surface antigen
LHGIRVRNATELRAAHLRRAARQYVETEDGHDMRKTVITAALVLMGTLAAPAQARADWLFTPWVGANWGGAANFTEFDDFEDEFERRGNFGATLGYMGGGILGFDIDFGWSPNFFQNTVGDDDFEFGDSNVTTLMANVKLGAPIGGQSGPGIRPYASGGVGLIMSRIDDPDDLFEVDSSDWGFNVGAGVTGFFSDNIGITGDVRYFRSLQDNEPDDEFDVALADFRYWRGSVGVTFRFGGN